MEIAETHGAYLLFSVALFLLVNWIGAHAASFGYSSTTLFSDPNDSLALNFVIRTLPPSVLIVLLSAIAVGSGHEELRLGTYWIAVYYYLIRLAYYFASNLYRLINWPGFIVHAAVGLGTALSAYEFLVVPKVSLLPDSTTVGNELWLAIALFLYAAANNVVLPDTGGARRRNAFIQDRYDRAIRRFGSHIEGAVKDDNLKLTFYAIIVYEDFCRPPFVRLIERLMFWKKRRTTGIMQVTSSKPLTDMESVLEGVAKLKDSWDQHHSAATWPRVRKTIADYNKDETYINSVNEVMHILATRIEPKFTSAFDQLHYEPVKRPESKGLQRAFQIRRQLLMLQRATGNANRRKSRKQP